MATKKVVKKAVKKVAKSVKLAKEKECADCGGSGLRDQFTLCTPCSGSGKV